MLWRLGFPLTEFTSYATAATEELTANAKAVAAEAGRPYIYSDRSRRRGGDLTKEDTARAIADRDGITEGVVCVFSVVEPCWSFQVRADHRTHRLEAIRRERKCVHHYLYLIDPEFGFMHVRVQAWIPYEIQIYVNGREWLARQLDAAGVGYRRYDNALLSVDDMDKADMLCDKLAHRSWPRLLNVFARRVNPLLAKITAAGFGGYYWVLDQAEIATDVMFRTRPQLLAIWPDLVRHASVNLSSTDVLRFLGRKLHPSLKAEVLTEAKRRPEGWRIKHRLARNWVKVYDKASVLRVETTINNPREFRILRVQDTDDRAGSGGGARCDKGVANMWRYFQVGIGANRRYLDALATATPNGEGIAALDALCRPRTNHGRHVARFHPLNRADLALFRAVLAGEHTHRRVPQPPPRGTPLHPTTRQRRRSPPPMPTGVPPDRQAARSRPHRQSPTSPALPCHPLRLPRAQRRHLRPRPHLPRRLPRSSLITPTFTRDTQILRTHSILPDLGPRRDDIHRSTNVRVVLSG